MREQRAGGLVRLLDLAHPRSHAVAVPTTHVHYDQQGRVEVPRRRILRIVLIVVAVVVVVGLIGWLIAFWLFNAGGTIPGTGTGDVITTP
jgi:fatty acid desaturase